jgi:hypothetical protein
MADWHEIVRKHLACSRLPQAQQQEIADEIAGHLEDRYEDLLRQGENPEEARTLACSELPRGNAFSNEIQFALKEDERNNRVKTVWLPAIGVAAMSMILFKLLQLPHVHMQRLASGGYLPLFDRRWILCLPLLGAWAAYWSRQSGGTISQRALAAATPALAFGSFLINFVAAVLLWNNHLHVKGVTSNFGQWLQGLALMLSICILLPMLALLLGALPFLRGHAEEAAPVALAR